MFPYNDDEIAWISKKPYSHHINQGILHSLFIVIIGSLIAATAPVAIYFSKLNFI